MIAVEHVCGFLKLQTKQNKKQINISQEIIRSAAGASPTLSLGNVTTEGAGVCYMIHNQTHADTGHVMRIQLSDWVVIRSFWTGSIRGLCVVGGCHGNGTLEISD